MNKIDSISPYLVVQTDLPSRPFVDNSDSFGGLLRWNSQLNQQEVYDGSDWVPFDHETATINLDRETESLLEWAREKREEEQKLCEMMEQYPALKKAKENFDVVLNLTKDNYKETT